MQTAVAQKASLRSSVAARPARAARSAVVVRASAEQSRRTVLGGLFAGVALTAANSASALTPVDLIDDRKAIEKGFEIIYEARDLDLPQSQRDGMTQARKDIATTIKRVKESEARIDSTLTEFVSKAYWTEAREELRRQVGTLRFDLAALASSKEKTARKAALALNKEFIAEVEGLDFAIRKKDKESALKKLVSTKTALDNALASLL